MKKKLLLSVASIIVFLGGTVIVTLVLNVVFLEEETIAPGVKVYGKDFSRNTRAELSNYLLQVEAELIQGDIKLKYQEHQWVLNKKDLGYAMNSAKVTGSAYEIGRNDSATINVKKRIKTWYKGADIPLAWEINQDKMIKAIDAIKGELEKLPEDAQFYLTETGEIAIKSEVIGRRIDLNNLQQNLINAVEKNSDYIEVPLITVIPSTIERDLKALEINTKLASKTTEFDSSNSARINNIIIAAEKINKYLLFEDDIFSFNEIVGSQSRDKGYQKAPIIVDGEFVDAVGGGICQVSTTIYNTALLSGLEIVERTPHSLPVSYVDLGLDAAVYYDYLDLKFKNNSGGNILVTAMVNKSNLKVSMYGKKDSLQDVILEQEAIKDSEYHQVKVVRKFLNDGEVISKEEVSNDKYPIQ
ncbi:vancomycin resistance protein YoaR [Desulfitispora alkaliphila]|uniref:VanW family protein n=1 Tax=Desulfitispora alkaliphila TaxID=622674 RepID=UPI003D1ECC0D